VNGVGDLFSELIQLATDGLMSRNVHADASNQSYRVADWVAYIALRLVICVIQMTSLERCDRVCRLLAYVMTDWIPIRRSLLAENFQLIYPEWGPRQSRKVTRAMWHHLLLMCCEVAHAPRKIHRENWHEHYRISDRRGILKVLMDDRPAVLVSGHFGNFELAGFITGLFGIPSTTIARPLDNGYIHDFVMGFRSLGGQHFLPKEGSSEEIQDLLREGGKLALLADQHAGEKGCWVEFLGRLASCHKGLALFTLSSGAPMMVCSNVRRDRPLQFDLTLLGVADPRAGGDHLSGIPALTTWYNERLERAIRKDPEQYWWVHRRWRAPPAARIRKVA
jgi:KDO2-lipid IV(A) lauroyltransferase